MKSTPRSRGAKTQEHITCSICVDEEDSSDGDFFSIFKLAEQEKRSNLSAQNNFRRDSEERRTEAASDSKLKEATVAEEGRILMRANYERILHEEKRRRLAEGFLYLSNFNVYYIHLCIS